jgi:hypothetical protein
MFSFEKNFKNHSSQREMIAENYLCLQKFEISGKGRNHCFCSSYFISLLIKKCCNFHGTGGKIGKQVRVQWFRMEVWEQFS